MTKDRVFISHSHKDHQFVERLARDLAARGLRVWYSEWEMRPGDSLTGKISEGMAASGSMIVVLSKQSVASKWVEKEFSLALTDSLTRKEVRILPILLEDCTFPRSFHFLGDVLYADFRTDYDEALGRLLSALGKRPSRRGLKLFLGDRSAIKAARPLGLNVAMMEGLGLSWVYDSRTQAVQLHLTGEARETNRPILEIPVNKNVARKLDRVVERLGWGYYHLVDDEYAPYSACVQVTGMTDDPDYVNLIWMLDPRRQRGFEIMFDRFAAEPLFDTD
jgi:hypothetical protein